MDTDAVFDDVLCPRIHALDSNLGWSREVTKTVSGRTANTHGEIPFLVLSGTGVWKNEKRESCWLFYESGREVERLVWQAPAGTTIAAAGLRELPSPRQSYRCSSQPQPFITRLQPSVNTLF